MEENMEENFFKDEYEIANRVVSVIGIPKELLNPEDIVSPEYKIKTKKYILKKLKNIISDIKDYEKENIRMAYVYYLVYLIAPTMPVRLPQRMENISTKTQFQTIDWNEFANEMYNRCEDLLNDLLEEHGEELVIGNTMVDLSDSVPYPNELV